MFKDYLRIAFRNFLKSKVHTAINLTGLTLGIACVFLISLYLKGELSYDRFHENAEDLYRITWDDENPQTRTPHPMAQALAADFPEVQSAVSLTPLWGVGLTKEIHSFRNLEKDERFDEANILAVDTTFFDVFSFPLVRGNPKTALKKIRGLVISESAAKRYFGDEDPMGKQLAVDSDTLLVEVVGVFKDVPKNSHFHFDFLVSYLREKYMDPEDQFYSWKDFGHYNYIRLAPGSDPKKLEEKLMTWSKKYLDWPEETYRGLAQANFGFRVQPVTDIHLQSHLRWELEANGNQDNIYILGFAALLTLIIACVNFMNLTTAKSAERAKEIGIRKSLGALRKQLAFQFISESILVAMVAVFLSVLVIELSLPIFNQMAGVALSFHYLSYVSILVVMGIFIGIVSGLYPALYLSGGNTISIMRGHLDKSQGGGLRDVLIIFQFGISMALISGSVIIFSQLDLLKNRSLGFAKENVLVIPIKTESTSHKFETFRNELLKIEGVASVSAASNIPGKQYNQHQIALVNSPEDDIASSNCVVDYDFFNVMGIELKEGRLFSRENLADTIRTYILNETAASQLNTAEVVGSEINWYLDGRTVRGRVIGVVKDFHFQSLHEPMRPLLFTMFPRYNYVLVKTKGENLAARLAAIESAYRQIDPIFNFEFSFLDDQLQQQYVGEQSLGKVIGVFTVIAIVIASFGLFGMALLSFFQRIKEVSIRKVLGASTNSLLFLLLRNFTILIIIGSIAAIPVTWWIMNRWLENFSYRVDVNPLIFVFSGLSLIVVCWATLGYLTLKTTKLNPADTLKSE